MTRIVGAQDGGRESKVSKELKFGIDDDFGIVTVDYNEKPAGKYPAKLHARNVAKYLGVTDGLIYLPGKREGFYEDSDQAVPFRQQRYFYYLTGVDFPDSIVTYNIKSDELSLWILPPNSGSSVIFNGQVPSIDEVKAEYEFDMVAELPNLESYLTWYAHNESGKIYLLHEYQAPKNITPQRLASKDGHWTWVTTSPFDTTSLIDAMNAARSVKSDHELMLIRKACSITAEAHLNVLKGIHGFQNEAEIEAIFAATCISQQAKRQSYDIIAGSGENASTLHYGANNEPLAGRENVVLDAGCEWSCYASDVTRTFPISGHWTKESKAIYDIVAKMQDECIAMCKSGVDWADVYIRSHKIAVVGLIKLGLLHNGTFDEIFGSGVSAAFFPHGLGHSVGLEVHDVTDTGSKLFTMGSAAFLETMSSTTAPRPSIILYPNMVYTVEPGLYFSRYALENIYLDSPKYSKYINSLLLPKYYPVGGVRIEDCIRITADGNENLTESIPKGEEALKIIRGGWDVASEGTGVLVAGVEKEKQQEKKDKVKCKDTRLKVRKARKGKWFW